MDRVEPPAPPDGVSVICEIASAHGGDAELLKRLLAAADAAGAEWTKVQVFRFAALVHEPNEAFQAMREIELADAAWRDVCRTAGTLASRLIAEVFDRPSFELIAGEPAVGAFKLPAAVLDDRALVEDMCRAGKPVFAATGGATLAEIDAVVELVGAHPEIPLVLMHGIQRFPTSLAAARLGRIAFFRQRYGLPVGYADHTDAEERELARALPAMALAAGASIIEKHITPDRSARGYDYHSALNPEEFSDFVAYVRQIAAAIGRAPHEELTAPEMAYREAMKRYAVASLPISEGTPFAESMVEYKRTSSPGLTREEVAANIGRRFVTDVPLGTVLRHDHL